MYDPMMADTRICASGFPDRLSRGAGLSKVRNLSVLGAFRRRVNRKRHGLLSDHICQQADLLQ